MWYNHLLSLHRMSFGPILVLFVTWPYHRTFRYFTLDPATKLKEDLGKEEFDGRRNVLANAINHWRVSKDHEYDFVCNASTLAAIADISVFSWTDIGNTYWLATAFFYFSLSLSLWAVILSTQQKSVTRTLSVYQDSPQQLRLKTRVILRVPEPATERRTFAELNMLYVWQCPLMLMSYGWATLLLGLTLHVCSPLIDYDGHDKRKVAKFYLATGVFLFLNFVWSSAWSFWLPPMSEDVERDTFRQSMVDISPTSPSTRSGTLYLPESRAGFAGPGPLPTAGGGMILEEEKEKMEMMSSKTL